MKKNFLIVILLLLFVSGCGHPGDTEDSSRSLDSNRAFTGGASNACATEDTVYFVVQHEGERKSYFMLHYMDKATGITGPLCGKAECKHADNTCNAYFDMVPTGLSVYDGRLYYLEETFTDLGHGRSVASVALDGTDRRAVRDVYSENLPLNSWHYFAAYFHRGYVYLAVQPYDIAEGESAARNTLYALPLDSGDEAAMILDEEESKIFRVQLYGDDIYIITCGSDNYDSLKIRRWDTASETMETVFEGQIPFGWLGDFWVTDDDIFLDGCVKTGADGNGNNIWQDDVYRYNFASEEISKVYTLMSRATCNIGVSENVFIDTTEANGGRRILIKDLDGNTVLDTVSSHEFWPAAPFIEGIDETNLYLYSQAAPEAFYAVPLDGSKPWVVWSDQA